MWLCSSGCNRSSGNICSGSACDRSRNQCHVMYEGAAPEEGTNSMFTIAAADGAATTFWRRHPPIAATTTKASSSTDRRGRAHRRVGREFAHTAWTYNTIQYTHHILDHHQPTKGVLELSWTHSWMEAKCDGWWVSPLYSCQGG